MNISSIQQPVAAVFDSSENMHLHAPLDSQRHFRIHLSKMDSCFQGKMYKRQNEIRPKSSQSAENHTNQNTDGTYSCGFAQMNGIVSSFQPSH